MMGPPAAREAAGPRGDRGPWWAACCSLFFCSSPRREGVPLAMQAAAGVVGGVQVVNAIRVGGVQQVQLDVVVALVDRNMGRTFGFTFFTAGGKTWNFGSVFNFNGASPMSAFNGSI